MSDSRAILFTSVCQPFERLSGGGLLTDQFAFRLTRAQELFVLRPHTHVTPLHLLAQNLSVPSVVLEYPTLEQLTDEVRHGYEYVAISFMLNHIDRLREMCQAIRKTSPRSRIIIGGYGTICTPEFLDDPEWKGLVDHICRGEGVSYLRALLGDSVGEPLRCQMPKMGSVLPWLSDRAVGTKATILSGLGCTYRCPFCNTSEYTKGRYVEVLRGEEIFQVMRAYWKNSPATESAIIYDENFLEQRDKVATLSRLIQQDRELGLAKLSYFSFSSLSALSRYEPEELLLSGLDTVWVGVESKFSSLKKRAGMTPEEGFRLLHSLGIKTIGSWIIGDDLQTQQNIQEDMDMFVSLDPTFQQLSVLTVTPTLPLWHGLKREGRIPDGLRWRDYHLYGSTFTAKGFTHEEMLVYLDQMYRRIYEEHGPAVVKAMEVNLNGYETCMRSGNRLLRDEKSQLFRRRCTNTYPLLKAAAQHAPSDVVRARVEALATRYRDVLGGEHLTRLDAKAAEIAELADAEAKRRAKRPYASVEERCRRYAYAALADRPSHCPYVVAHLQAPTVHGSAERGLGEGPSSRAPGPDTPAAQPLSP